MIDRKAVWLDRGWGIILRDLGIQPENVLRRAQLPRDLLTQEQARVSVEEYVRLWNALEAEADDPALPIRLGHIVLWSRRAARLFGGGSPAATGDDDIPSSLLAFGFAHPGHHHHHTRCRLDPRLAPPPGDDS